MENLDKVLGFQPTPKVLLARDIELGSIAGDLFFNLVELRQISI